MRPTTETFKQLMASGNARKYQINVNMTLADSTQLTLTEEDIWSDSFSIETASSGTSSFDLGTAVIGKCKFSINNFDERFSQYDFFNATAIVWVKLVGDSTYYRMGFFTVDEPVYASSLISLELLDNMWKFDVPLSSVNLTFPITIRNALVAICSYCGVSLATQSFHGYDFTLSTAPEKDMNCREFIQYCAMIGCNFCTINATGALELKWYNTSAIPSGSDLDGGSFRTSTTPYSDGDSADGGTFAFNDGDSYDGGTFTDNSDCVWFTRNMQASFGTDVITITGVKFIINETSYSIGSAGYVLELENPLVDASNVNSVLNLIWDVLEGFTLRTFNLTTASDLSAEIGDCCILKDYKGNNIYSWITLNTFKFANHVVQCNAVSPTRTLEKRYSKTVSAAVEATRKQTEEIISDYDLAVQLMNDVAVNAMGGYEDYEDLPTGGRVYYLSNMPITKSASGTCSFQSGSTVFKKTGDGFYVSTDAGTTWQNGYNAQTGQLIVNVLNAIGISAEWIKTGTLTVGGSGVGNPLISVKDSTNNTVVTLDANGITSYAGVIRSANENFLFNMSTGECRIAAGTGIYDPNADYSGAYVPTNSNYPASSWSSSDKPNHEGDTFVNTSTKKTYVYKMTPPEFESEHPYASSVDEYYEFIVPSSWTTAYVSFDSQCETEGGNYDYLDFYYTLSGSTYKQRVQGSDFKSKDLAIVVSEIHKFYLHWRTDSSVVKWGWKFTVSNASSQSAITPSWSFESLPSVTWTQKDITSGATYEWVEATITEYIDAKAKQSEQQDLTQEQVYNILTNNGQTQGIFLNSSDNKLYINGQYFTSNAITIGGSNYNQKPYLEIKDNSGTQIGRWDVNGIMANAGTFGKLKVFTDSSNITYLKYVASGYRYYLNESWGAGKITNANRVVRCLINPYREGWQTDAQIKVDFAMSVRNVASYKTATQCVLKLYKYTNGTRSEELTANIKYDGTGTNINTTEVYDEETGQWIINNWLDYPFDHNHGANPGDTYYITCTVEKRNATYTNNGGTTLSINDNGNGSGFVVREGSDHRAVCSGRFLGEFTGDATLDTIKVGDYILCGDGEYTTSTHDGSSTYGASVNYDGVRVWHGTEDWGDSDDMMYLSYGDLSKEEGGTPYYLSWQTSDERAKEEIEDLDSDLSKRFIDSIRTRKFKYKGAEGKHYGVIAQETREILDNLGEEDSKLEYIAGKPDGKIPNQRSVHYEEFVPHLINYVKDLRSEVEELKAEIKTLKGE